MEEQRKPSLTDGDIELLHETMKKALCEAIQEGAPVVAEMLKNGAPVLAEALMAAAHDNLEVYIGRGVLGWIKKAVLAAMVSFGIYLLIKSGGKL